MCGKKLQGTKIDNGVPRPLVYSYFQFILSLNEIRKFHSRVLIMLIICRNFNKKILRRQNADERPRGIKTRFSSFTFFLYFIFDFLGWAKQTTRFFFLGEKKKKPVDWQDTDSIKSACL